MKEYYNPTIELNITDTGINIKNLIFAELIIVYILRL